MLQLVQTRDAKQCQPGNCELVIRTDSSATVTESIESSEVKQLNHEQLHR